MVVVFRNAATWVPKMRERSYNQDLDRVAKSLPSLAHYVDVPVHERGRSFPGGVAPAAERANTSVAQWQSVQQAQGTTLRWGKSNYCEQDDSDLPLHSKCFQGD